MIFIDIDGPCIDFIERAKDFGFALKPNNFAKWHWWQNGFCVYGCGKKCKFPTPKEFYTSARLQPWFFEMLYFLNPFNFITKDFCLIKKKFLENYVEPGFEVIEAPDGKHHFCKQSTDLLIDDNAAECEAWRAKGGIAYHFNLAQKDPFVRFRKWYSLEGRE